MDDNLDGGKGDDSLYGWLGNDRIKGGSGNDYLSGWLGDDRLHGGKGHDEIFGHDGNDVLRGGRGDEIISGGDGDDRIHGNHGDDVLYGDAGNDRIKGGKGRDIIISDPPAPEPEPVVVVDPPAPPAPEPAPAVVVDPPTPPAPEPEPAVVVDPPAPPAPEPEPEFDRSFDFGPGYSLVADGFSLIHADTTYTPELGVGWTSGTVDQRDRGIWGSDTTRDFNFTTDATFAIDVLPEPAVYDVTITMGDGRLATPTREDMGVFLEGVQVDSVTSLPTQYVTSTYQVTVTDGQLNLALRDLGGSDPWVMINSMEVHYAGPAATV